jgi:phospholipase/carboxylesterase
LRAERPLAGVMVLSGYLLIPDRLEEERQPGGRQTPFLFCHGRYDPVVPLRLGQASFARVTRAGYNAEWSEYDMQHSLCLEEVRRIRSWLEQRFPSQR